MKEMLFVPYLLFEGDYGWSSESKLAKEEKLILLKENASPTETCKCLTRDLSHQAKNRTQKHSIIITLMEQREY